MKILHLLLHSSLVLFASAQKDGLKISTREGPVTGTLVSSTVRQFLGIPYAVANRWEAPKPAPARSRPLDATKFSDSCLQALNAASLEFFKLVGEATAVPESENCLSINIWAPSIQRKQNTAVMLWIYGGAFQIGTSNAPFYDGQNLVRDQDDVLIVTFNYRLNIFGQPGTPQLASNTTSQNFGLLDLDAAVQWVHTNIAAFGGDPERIILFGQSAGGTAADAYTFAHPTDTIIKGVIEQSGNLAINGGSLTTTLDPAPWNNVSVAVGCGNTPSTTQFECMKAVPSRKLEDAVISTNAAFFLVQDNINVFSDVDTRAAAGNFLRVPVLGGSTQHEGDISVIEIQEVSGGHALPVLTELISDITTQLWFTCPASKISNDRAKIGVPTWRYQYQGIFPGISTRPDLRAFHGSEVVMIFGTYGPPANATDEEKALSKYMQSAWVAFARDPVKGLLKLNWQTYNPKTDGLAQLGSYDNRGGVTFTQAQPLDLTCTATAQSTLASVMEQLTGLLTMPGI